MNSLKRPERENLDLNADDEAGAPDGGAEDAATPGEAGAAVAAAVDPAQRRPRRVKITYGEYERIGQMLAGYLKSKEASDEDVREEDLIAWYMEQVENEIQTEAQLFEQQYLVQLIINRLIDKDRVIIVLRPSDDPMRPEARVLVKHPNYLVGEVISGKRRE